MNSLLVYTNQVQRTTFMSKCLLCSLSPCIIYCGVPTLVVCVGGGGVGLWVLHLLMFRFLYHRSCLSDVLS